MQDRETLRTLALYSFGFFVDAMIQREYPIFGHRQNKITTFELLSRGVIVE